MIFAYHFPFHCQRYCIFNLLLVIISTAVNQSLNRSSLYCLSRSKIKKRLLGSSGSSGMPRRTGAIRIRRSRLSWKGKVNVGYSYREMFATDLQLNDAGKHQPVYENCRSSADCAETGVQTERVQDKGNETKTIDTGSNELTEFRTNLEVAADDLDAWKQPVYENCWSSAGSAECGLENRVPGLSRSARTQSRKGAKHTPKIPSSVKEQVHVVFCYPEILSNRVL